ncbi:MAG: MmgE/PrpD family protein [Proteobacteria bacterium]|nr:MmgE/PrpD family protein [Pseudomonadota bacterium]
MQDNTTTASEITETLAAFAAGLTFEDLPEKLIAHMRLSALDALGCCLVGATLPWTRMVADLVRAEGGAPQARLIGTGDRVPLAAAALVNATAGHAFELDDIHRDSIIHPNSICVPVALNCAEAMGGASGRAVVTAIAAGYEVATRVGMAGGTDLLLRGFHPQGTGGAIAAAVTAGHMYGLDAAGMRNAIGIAGSLGSGLMAAQEGAMVKRLHSGNAAQAGVRAVLLAQNGFTGISNLVEAEYGGFLSSFAGAVDMSRITEGLGTHWEADETGFKPYATVTSIHAALDSLAKIMRENGLAADDIAKIRVGTSKATYVHCAWPYEAQSVTAAQMNLYYGLAMIALDGAAFVDQFDESRIADPAVFDFIGRIEAAVDPEIDGLGREFRHMARLSVATVDGRHFSHEERHRRGSPQNPVSEADMTAKFRTLAAGSLSADRVDGVIDLCGRLDELADVGPLIDAVSDPQHDP